MDDDARLESYREQLLKAMADLGRLSPPTARSYRELSDAGTKTARWDAIKTWRDLPHSLIDPLAHPPLIIDHPAYVAFEAAPPEQTVRSRIDNVGHERTGALRP